MKKIYLGDVLRILGGILLIGLGIILMIFHKDFVPSWWEISDLTIALTTVWAFAGPFVGAILAGLGIYATGLPEYYLEKKGWLK